MKFARVESVPSREERGMEKASAGEETGGRERNRWDSRSRGAFDLSLSSLPPCSRLPQGTLPPVLRASRGEHSIVPWSRAGFGWNERKGRGQTRCRRNQCSRSSSAKKRVRRPSSLGFSLFPFFFFFDLAPAVVEYEAPVTASSKARPSASAAAARRGAPGAPL